MPTNVAKLAKALQKLSLALARQSVDRQKREAANVRETARILTTIGNLMGDVPGVDIKDLGPDFASVCNFGGPGPLPPPPRKPVKGSK
jgi:hypothetical protein